MLSDQQFVAQLGGLVLVIVLIAVLRGARQLYLRIVARRVYRAADQPLPGRTRDLTTGAPTPRVRRAS